jgi:hypothetical protein
MKKLQRIGQFESSQLRLYYEEQRMPSERTFDDCNIISGTHLNLYAHEPGSILLFVKFGKVVLGIGADTTDTVGSTIQRIQ